MTGVWDGTFVQPQVGMVTFLATFIESGGALGGNVTEPCILPDFPLKTHNASIAGRRSGSTVLFVKCYKQPSHGYSAVSCEGLVNARRRKSVALEVAGAALSGRFLIVRWTKTAEAVVIEERIKEPAR